jgi:hypothetical protein
MRQRRVALSCQVAHDIRSGRDTVDGNDAARGTADGLVTICLLQETMLEYLSSA